MHISYSSKTIQTLQCLKNIPETEIPTCKVYQSIRTISAPLDSFTPKNQIDDRDVTSSLFHGSNPILIRTRGTSPFDRFSGILIKTQRIWYFLQWHVVNAMLLQQRIQRALDHVSVRNSKIVGG